MEEQKQSATPTNPDATQRSAHPFVQMLFQGMLDILDEDDIKMHLNEQEVESLVDASNRLRRMNPLKERLETHVGSFVVTFEASIKDLLEYPCLRSSLQVNAPESSCMRRPFLDHGACISEQNPPGWLEQIKSQVKIMPAAMNAKVVHNGFAGLLKEPLKFGSSVSEKFLEVMSTIDKSNLMAQNYRASLITKTLTFNLDTSIADTVQLAPMMPDTELNRFCTTGFLTREIVERGVLKRKIGEKTFYYFPEEHGLSHVLKIGGPSLVSGVRVYALQLPKDDQHRTAADQPRVFVRIPEKAYEAAMDYLFTKEITPKLDRTMPTREIAFWIGYKTPGEQWTDENEKARLSDMCRDELNKKHKISFRVTAAIVTPSAKQPSGQDLFWSSPDVVGSYLPGMPFVDGCNTQAKKPNEPAAAGTSRTYKDIRARALPHYLKEHKKERKAFKEEGLKLRSGEGKNKDYLDALLDV